MKPKPFPVNGNCGIKKQGREVLTHLTASNLKTPEKEVLMADKANMGIPPNKSISNWKSIGEIAARLAEKAVQK